MGYFLVSWLLIGFISRLLFCVIIPLDISRTTPTKEIILEIVATLGCVIGGMATPIFLLVGFIDEIGAKIDKWRGL